MRFIECFKNSCLSHLLFLLVEQRVQIFQPSFLYAILANTEVYGQIIQNKTDY